MTAIDILGPRTVTEPERVLLLAAASPAELSALLDRADTDVLALPPGTAIGARLGIVDPTPRRLALARKVVARGRALRGRDDVWFSPDQLLRGGRTAFVFPGLEADFAPRVDDLAELLGVPVPDLGTQTVGRHGGAVLAVGRLLDAALRRMAIVPDAVAGHSVGEWTAMIAGGVVSGADFDAMLARTDLDALRVPGVEFAVLGCPAARAAEAIAHSPELVISHENSTNQTVVCGPADRIAELVERMRAAAVICQVLPFRSGFHTPMLAPFLGEFEQGVPSLRMHPAAIPVWSANTASPFPDDPALARELCVRHLVEPVRFRATIQALYDSGVRVFVQAGPGQLGSLIDDTLRDAVHLTVAANSGQRCGVDQLRRVAAALWAEGGNPDFTALAPRKAEEPVEPSLSRLSELAVRFPALRELTALIDETTDAVAAVLTAAGRPAMTPREFSLTVSTSDMPYLADHCFARQRDGWPDETDLRPVVPATTVVQHLIDAARSAAPGRVVVGVDNLRFRRWLVAAPATEVAVSVRPLDSDRVEVRLGDYADGTVVLGDSYPQAPRPWTPKAGERAPSLSAADLYAQRWLFHGPSYQGISRTLAVSDDDARAEITVPEAPGALLDNVGQVIGHWLVENHPQRWIAFPIAINRIRFHRPAPGIGSTVDCSMRVTGIELATVRADAQVTAGGEVAVSIEGWTDTRFDSDAAIGSVHRFPETSTLSWRADGGWWAAAERWPSLASREFYLRKYLGAAEIAEYEACDPTERRRWLLRRIVVKDAVRGRLWDDGYGPLFPAELRVREDASGRCAVTGVGGLEIPDLTVNVDSSHEFGVAMVEGQIAIAELEWPPARNRDPRLMAAASAASELIVNAGGARIELVANPDGLPVRQYVVAWVPGQSTTQKEETS
ncbi:acyltransferase domain-containing protein [Actinokineospora xionganensis]|uniref:Polyketide synthase dehydratase domain-containing protein n=1 Tax=Actinokineospora xionganensis TaxID=2684470 RepID=A0ABR7KZM8_9PSEU|nr:acyltransferase domain-containing protein [Actinokineospora xionganensis]MBC6445566.1 polyketide synthase dehydratase domain-containing protein [Actinokineospora xionganensis]